MILPYELVTVMNKPALHYEEGADFNTCSNHGTGRQLFPTSGTCLRNVDFGRPSKHLSVNVSSVKVFILYS
jgi:hypothetical protein